MCLKQRQLPVLICFKGGKIQKVLLDMQQKTWVENQVHGNSF